MRYAILIALLVACAPAEAEHEAVIETPDAKEVAPAPPITLALNALSGSGPGWSADTDGCMQYNYAAAGGHLLVPLPLPEGASMSSIVVQLSGDGIADIDAVVFSLSSTMIKSAIGAAYIRNPPPTWTAYSVALGTGSVLPGGSLFLDIDANAVGPRAGTVSVQYR
jgi:hypothetical protein